ncbi:hypothetical protein FC093_13445 [Ilyomonas limi]|uniref:ATP-binding protein n=1 Tax=Ilyomonas limi TaxID=2575867 RepID=A0A4U3L0M5_9BACT|nr:AAA family ATPase [Ilyomonas limi]TKK67749.1 hypothetical protein FC093_13445 [Ilyomonas limi]
MKKPLLIVITGRPASGKTTLAHLLAREIKYPLLSRDEFKEGYINTAECCHNQLDKTVTRDIYETFFKAVDLLISANISLIIEAAFQHKLWEPKLSNYLGKAQVRIVVCELPPLLAKTRFINRALNDQDRERFHGDLSLNSANELVGVPIASYEAPILPVPILQVDTTDGYNPNLSKIVKFIKLKS